MRDFDLAKLEEEFANLFGLGSSFETGNEQLLRKCESYRF